MNLDGVVAAMRGDHLEVVRIMTQVMRGLLVAVLDGSQVIGCVQGMWIDSQLISDVLSFLIDFKDGDFNGFQKDWFRSDFTDWFIMDVVYYFLMDLEYWSVADFEDQVVTDYPCYN